MRRLNPRQLSVLLVAVLLGASSVLMLALGHPTLSLASIVLILVLCTALLLDVRRRGQEANEMLRGLATRVHAIDRRDQRMASDLTTSGRTLGEVSRALADHRDEQRAAADADEARTRELAAQLSQIRYEPIGEISALLALHHRFRPRASLEAHAASALAPTAIARLVDVITTERPRLVVECGSGLSTIWMGYALAETGSGRLVALEHHRRFLERTRAMVLAHHLQDVVEVRHAPLGPVLVDGDEYQWYQADVDDLRDIGLLLVDGPPAGTDETARFPALPVLGDRVLPGALIALDDTSRAGERAVLERWTALRPDLRITHEFAGRTASLRTQ